MIFDYFRNTARRSAASCYQLYSVNADGKFEHVNIDVLRKLKENGFDAVKYTAMGQISTYVFIDPSEMQALEEQSTALNFEIAKTPVDWPMARLIAKSPGAF